MRKVEPPQLIQALIEQQEIPKTLTEINLTVKKFNELAREMAKLEFQLDFSYRELLDFASSFHNDIVLINEVDLHLHITEALRERLEWYNKMYTDIHEPLKNSNIWKMLGK